MHLLCCQKFVFGKHNLEPLVGPIGQHAVACTKKCYIKAASLTLPATPRETPNHAPTIQSIIDSSPIDTPTLLLLPACGSTQGPAVQPTTVKERIAWNKDGAGGPLDPNNSERILIDWLCTPGNYSKFRGNDNHGTRKIQYAHQIAERMKVAGVRKLRTDKDVLNKIEYIKKCFKSAHDFANTETGAGLMENDKGTFEDAVMKKCPWYFDLLDCFQDRASARPSWTTDKMMYGRQNDDSDDDANSINSDTSGADINVRFPDANDASIVETRYGGKVDLTESEEDDDYERNKENTNSDFSLIYDDTHSAMCPVRVVKKVPPFVNIAPKKMLLSLMLLSAEEMLLLMEMVLERKILVRHQSIARWLSSERTKKTRKILVRL